MGDTGNYYSEESLILSAFSGDTGNYYSEESLILSAFSGDTGNFYCEGIGAMQRENEKARKIRRSSQQVNPCFPTYYLRQDLLIFGFAPLPSQKVNPCFP